MQNTELPLLITYRSKMSSLTLEAEEEQKDHSIRIANNVNVLIFGKLEVSFRKVNIFLVNNSTAVLLGILTNMLKAYVYTAI